MKKYFIILLFALCSMAASAKDVYCVINVSVSSMKNYEVWADYGKDKDKEACKELGAIYVDSLAQILNAMAENGWKLVSVNNALAQRYSFIFVREEKDKEEQ